MGLSILSCLALYKLCAIEVHDVRMCVVDSLGKCHFFTGRRPLEIFQVL